MPLFVAALHSSRTHPLCCPVKRPPPSSITSTTAEEVKAKRSLLLVDNRRTTGGIEGDLDYNSPLDSVEWTTTAKTASHLIHTQREKAPGLDPGRFAGQSISQSIQVWKEQVLSVFS